MESGKVYLELNGQKNAAYFHIACVAGGEAANSLAGFASEGIFASGKAASKIPNSTRLLPILLAT